MNGFYLTRLGVYMLWSSWAFSCMVIGFTAMEKPRTTSSPLRESTGKHSIYTYMLLPVHASARYPLTCLLMQDSLDRLCQFPQHNWLHQESIYTSSLCLLLIEIVAKASAQNDGNLWTNTPQLLG
jgi:hypothetical protein